jgi:biofilm PGA synthesis N-glycosyltransferase PgaC
MFIALTAAVALFLLAATPVVLGSFGYRIVLRRPEPPVVAYDHRVAILVASHNGSGSIAATIESARGQADVYVVTDGCTDDTAEVARAAGARVLELDENVGKPAAIFTAMGRLGLTQSYRAVAILDDDTVIAPDFVAECMKALRPGVAIVVGRTMTRWDRSRRWNVWLGCRAYAYWRYQVTIRRGQSAVNALNCISGSNSLYRSSVLDEVLVADTPYIVDDTYWTLETHRRKLGKIVYVPTAKAWICDPIAFGAWYRQNVRWLWGTFQGVWGHRVGTRRTMFDACYVLLILDWILYVAFAPTILVLAFTTGYFSPATILLLYGVGVLAWVSAGAIATKQWRLVLMAPAIVLIDWVYRVGFVHAFLKTLRQPRVEVCRWESPARY